MKLVLKIVGIILGATWQIWIPLVVRALNIPAWVAVGAVTVLFIGIVLGCMTDKRAPREMGAPR